MGSEVKSKIPFFDFSKEVIDMKQGSEEWKVLCNNVRATLEEFGWFEVAYDRVPEKLSGELFSALKDLFDLPEETKLKNLTSKPYYGYIGGSDAGPLYESLGIENAPTLDGAQAFTDLMWPDGNPAFCKTVYCFSKQVSELDKIVRRMILESLGIEKYYNDHIESSNYLLRVMKYEGPQTHETKLIINSHIDKNLLSILHQNQIDGLEMQTKDGEWIPVKLSSGSFIVMISESYFAWTNGRLHPPHHRVMMSGNEPRYSIGLFSNPKAGLKVQTPKELVDDDHPLLFKPFDYIEYLNYYYTEVGRDYAEVAKKAEPNLKSFCGV